MEKEMHELKTVSIRLVDEPPLFSEQPIQTPEDAVSLLGEDMSKYDREILSVINLTNKGQVINTNLVSMGSLSYSIAAPREIFKSSILSNAASIILMHNHPSGDPSPSREDWDVTKRMDECGELLGIRLLDHIIVGNNGRYYSYTEHEEMPRQTREKEQNSIAAENSGPPDQEERGSAR